VCFIVEVKRQQCMSVFADVGHIVMPAFTGMTWIDDAYVTVDTSPLNTRFTSGRLRNDSRKAGGQCSTIKAS
jgi:hypothetical protein